MEWVVGIGIGLFLFIRYPRPMFIVTGVVILIGGGILGSMILDDRQRAAESQRLRDSVVISVNFDAGRCGPEHPLIVSFENRNSETLLSLSFRLTGFRDGHSEPVYQSLSIDSDRIIRSGEKHTACWSVPSTAYGSSNPPPPETVTWKARLAYPDPKFGAPP
jgi:hypothetical protein